MRPLLFLPLVASGCFGLLSNDRNDPPDISHIDNDSSFTDARPLDLFVEVDHRVDEDFVRDGQLLARDGTVLGEFQRGVGNEWLLSVEFEHVAPVIGLNTEASGYGPSTDEPESVEFVVRFSTERDVEETRRFRVDMHCDVGIACDGVCVPTEDDCT